MKQNRRMNLIKAAFFLIGCVLIWKLYNLQIVKGNYYADISLRQNGINSIKSERGNIYFQDKNGELAPAAINKSDFTLAINPSLVSAESRLLYEKISATVELDYDNFFQKISKKDDPFEILVRRLDKETAEKIKDLQKEYKGLILVPEKWRFYPANNLAAHILGFVGYDKDVLKGRYGLEKFYDSYLGGREIIKRRSFFESLLSLGQKIFANYETGETSLILTIEPILQAELEFNLEKIFQKYGAVSAGGIIINPRNGKILAMAAKPDFNPNAYSKVEDISVFMNPLVENIFEMGSVFKPLTLAAAIDQEAIRPETIYYDKGFVFFNNKRIENYDGKARGEVDMQTVLNKSLNTGAVFAMQSLGKEKFKSYVVNYGLKEETGIDLPGEVRGKIDNLYSGRDIEFATASFGQGIAVSPIEFAVAFSSLVNGGNIIQPYLVNGVIQSSDSKKSDQIFFKNKNGFFVFCLKSENVDSQFFIFERCDQRVKNKVLRSETSETINRMLARVVDEALLEGTVKMDRYSIGAKTGTAQKIKSETPGYSEDYLHTFVGFFPAFDPQFLIFLFLEKPSGVRYASHSLTPAFMDMTRFILNYYEIPPDR